MKALELAVGIVCCLIIWVPFLLFVTTMSALLLRLSCEIFNWFAGVTNRSPPETPRLNVDRSSDPDDEDDRPRPRVQPENLDPTAPGVSTLRMRLAMKICGIHLASSLVVGIVAALVMHFGAMTLRLDRGNPFTADDITKCVCVIDIVIGYFLMVGLLCVLLPTTFRKANGIAGLYVTAMICIVLLISIPFLLLGAVIWAVG
jgi:hypothetical protein